MTNYESDHLNPPNEREVKTCDCEHCNGTGEEFVWDDFIEAYTKEQCPNCEGKGYLEY